MRPSVNEAMSFGSFTLPVQQLRAFSSSYFSFEGALVGGQLIELRGEGGAVGAPAGLRVAVVRVKKSLTGLREFRRCQRAPAPAHPRTRYGPNCGQRRHGGPVRRRHR